MRSAGNDLFGTSTLRTNPAPHSGQAEEPAETEAVGTEAVGTEAVETEAVGIEAVEGDASAGRSQGSLMWTALKRRVKSDLSKKKDEEKEEKRRRGEERRNIVSFEEKHKYQEYQSVNSS
jgi:hypothetical protein